MMTKQEIIEALKHCKLEHDDLQCHGCPGEDGNYCKFMGFGDNVDIPVDLIDCAIGYLDVPDGEEEAWKLAQKIAAPVNSGGLSAEELYGIFGTVFTSDIFSDNSFSEAADKMRAYKDKVEREDINIGDEVVFGDKKQMAVVACVGQVGDKKWIRVIDSQGLSYSVIASDCKKTGRHFDEMEQLLKLIGGVDQ